MIGPLERNLLARAFWLRRNKRPDVELEAVFADRAEELGLRGLADMLRGDDEVVRWSALWHFLTMVRRGGAPGRRPLRLEKAALFVNGRSLFNQCHDLSIERQPNVRWGPDLPGWQQAEPPSVRIVARGILATFARRAVEIGGVVDVAWFQGTTGGVASCRLASHASHCDLVRGLVEEFVFEGVELP